MASEEGLILERDERRLSRPETMGLYSPTERLIVVRDAAPRQMTKTLAHELAHHFKRALGRIADLSGQLVDRLERQDWAASNP